MASALDNLDPALAEKIARASGFIGQSPPGEINDVLNDVRAIIADDHALETGIRPALREYNLKQFLTVAVPGQNHQTIISEASIVSLNDEQEGERYLDPKSYTTFSFDHLRLEASDPQPIERDETGEPFRLALETALLKYIADHYADGTGAVLLTSDASKFIIQIVANKYNPPNYWSGRWRSQYDVNMSKGEVTGKVFIDVHYYEQGNVQLTTSHSPTFTFPTTSGPTSTTAQKIINHLENLEGEYQRSLTDVYHEMGEKAFKALRRALPLTRQKLDWDKVLGYKLGAELASGRAVFGGNS
jgi:capping protein alpha